LINLHLSKNFKFQNTAHRTTLQIGKRSSCYCDKFNNKNWLLRKAMQITVFFLKKPLIFLCCTACFSFPPANSRLFGSVDDNRKCEFATTNNSGKDAVFKIYR
jgi:hypothetical protein